MGCKLINYVVYGYTTYKLPYHTKLRGKWGKAKFLTKI